MWEFEIKHKRTSQTRKIFGETTGNAFRRFGLEPDAWILMKKREVDLSPGELDGTGGGRRTR